MSVTRLLGAGVLPFYRSGDGEPHFVFGREQATPSWSASHKLSSFSGRAHDGEGAEDTAARELHEESLGAFARESLPQELRQGAFALRVVHEIVRGRTTLSHVTFVREVSPTCNWMEHFCDMRAHVVRAELLLAEWTTLYQRLINHPTLLMPALTSGWLDVRLLHSHMFVRCKHTGAETSFDTQTLPLAVCVDYVRWCVVGRHLHTLRDLFQRKCPGVMRRNFTLDESFCEIDAIFDWSYTELSEMRQRGFAPRMFRREFLPVLNKILSAFAPATRDQG